MATLQDGNTVIDYRIESITELYCKSRVSFFIGGESVFNPKLSPHGFFILEDVDDSFVHLLHNVLETNESQSLMDVDGEVTISLYPDEVFPFLPTNDYMKTTDTKAYGYYSVVFHFGGSYFGATGHCGTTCSFVITVNDKAVLKEFLEQILQEASCVLHPTSEKTQKLVPLAKL